MNGRPTNSIVESPWWYRQVPRDFMSSPDVELMSAEEIGCYFLLLQRAWLSGESCTLPNDPARLARLARVDKVSEIVLSKFSVDKDGRLFNWRLSQEWKDALKRTKDSRNANKARWEAELRADSDRTPGGLPLESKGSPNNNNKHKNKTKTIKTMQAQVSELSSGEEPTGSPSTSTAHGPQPSEAAVRLASSLAQILGRADLKPGTQIAWAQQADSILAKQHSEQTVAAVMKWALVDSDNMFWRGRVYAMKNFAKCFKSILAQYTRGDQNRGAAADPLAARAASLKSGHDFSAISKGDL
jgi:uncharacterized protein YdaU (DUF1376 family)